MPPSRLKIVLSIAGLAAIAASLLLAFQDPFGLWHWVLLLVAVACLLISRRLGS